MKKWRKTLISPLAPDGLFHQLERVGNEAPVIQSARFEQSRRNRQWHPIGARWSGAGGRLARSGTSRRLTYQQFIKPGEHRGARDALTETDEMAASSLGQSGCENPLDQEQRDRSHPKPGPLAGKQHPHQTSTLSEAISHWYIGLRSLTDELQRNESARHAVF